MSDVAVVDVPVVAEPVAEPITAYLNVLDQTVIGEYADAVKATTAAASAWSALNQAVDIRVVGIPTSLKGLKKFEWNMKVSVWQLPDVATFYARARFEEPFTPRG